MSKPEIQPITCHERIEGESSCSCTLSSTSALEGVGGQCHTSAALTRE